MFPLLITDNAILSHDHMFIISGPARPVHKSHKVLCCPIYQKVGKAPQGNRIKFQQTFLFSIFLLSSARPSNGELYAGKGNLFCIPRISTVAPCKIEAIRGVKLKIEDGSALSCNGILQDHPSISPFAGLVGLIRLGEDVAVVSRPLQERPVDAAFGRRV